MGTANSGDTCIDPLDFHAPFISTRRSTGSIHTTNIINPNEESPRVPFSWERTAGVPKDTVRRRNSYREFIPMPPKPPPGRWRPRGEERNIYPMSEDDGNDGDIDRGDGSDGDDNDGEDIFSDALDRLSLSEEASGIGYIEPTIVRAPSFIMNRFLPAAKACARVPANPSATLKLSSKKSSRRDPSSSHQRAERELAKHRRTHRAITSDAKLPIGYVPPIRTRPTTTPKGCGLVLLSPWSLNSRLRGLKNPTECRTPATTRPMGYSGDGSSFDDSTNPKAWRAPGWGLPFLDTSRLRTIRSKVRDFTDARQPRAGERATWSLPPVKSPSESWLSHAVNSFNRTK